MLSEISQRKIISNGILICGILKKKKSKKSITTVTRVRGSRRGKTGNG